MIEDSIRIKEVWEWKEQAYNEVKHLPLEMQIEKIIENSNKTGKKYLEDVKNSRLTSRLKKGIADATSGRAGQ